MHTDVDHFAIDQVLGLHLGASISGTRVDIMIHNHASLRSLDDFLDLASARVGIASLLCRVAANDDFLADRFKRLKLSMRNVLSATIGIVGGGRVFKLYRVGIDDADGKVIS